MAHRVVTAHRRSHVARRGVAFVASLVGAVLVLVGLVALAFPVVVAAVTLAAVFTGGDRPQVDADTTRALAVCVGVALVTIVVGRALLRGHRREALFLRKFGFDDASRAVTFAVGTALGRHWRLVTLDDDEIAPVGASRRARRTSSVLWLVAVAAVVVGILWLTGDGLRGVVDRATQQASADVEDRRGGVADQIVAPALAGLIAAVVAVLMVGMALVLVGAVGVFSGASYLSVRRAERAKAPRITDIGDVAPVVERVGHAVHRVLGPRLVVVRVAGEVWQQAVRGFAATASAVLIDLSAPTENLLWEIEAGSRAARQRWVLIGRQDRVGPTFVGLVPDPAIARRLDVALAGEEILAYDSSSRAGRRRFSRALRHRLDAIG